MLQLDYTAWTSLGVIVGDVAIGAGVRDGERAYKWHNCINDINRAARVGAFIEYVEDPKKPCLLIAQAAEELSVSGITPKCMVMTSEEEAQQESSIVGVWDKPDEAFCNIFNGAGLEEEKVDWLRPRWKEYIFQISNVTDAYKDSIIYIPAVCVRDGEPILVGGLVWCVRQKELAAALSQLADAQVMLRWALSEVLASMPELGVPVTGKDKSNPLRDQMIQNNFIADEHPWYKHNYEDIQNKQKVLWSLKKHLPEIANYPKELHDALKKIKTPSNCEISPAMLYILAISAVIHKQGDITWGQIPPEAYNSKYPFRGHIGRIHYSERVLEAFYKFVRASVQMKNSHTQITKRILVTGNGITIEIHDLGYAEGLCKKIHESFEHEFKDLGHNTSGPLSWFIQWSGSEFQHSADTGGAAACVKVYTNIGCSVVEVVGAKA